MDQKTTFLIPCFPSLLAKEPPALRTWQEIHAAVCGPLLKNHTDNYRRRKAELDELIAQGADTHTPQLVKRKDKELKRLKEQAPAFAPAVQLAEGRAAAHIRSYTGFTLVDLDHVPAEEMERVLQLVRHDPHTFFQQVTFSGSGIRIVARTDQPVDAKNYPQLFHTVNAYYAQLTGVAFDEKCKNANRLSALCHDPNALLRPDAECFAIDPKAAPEKRKLSRADRLSKLVKQLVEKSGVRYEPHHHNDFIMRAVCWMNRFGVQQPQTEEWALRTFSDYDASAIQRTVKSCYDNHNDEFDSERASDFRLPRTDGRNAPKRVKLKEIETYLSARYKFRYNLQLQSVEMASATSDTPDWQRLTDRLENSLWRNLNNDNLTVELSHLRSLLGSDYVPDFDPVPAYLQSLQPWDGKTDYIRLLAKRVTVEPCRDSKGTTPEEQQKEVDDLFYDCLKRWLVGLLACALRFTDQTNQVIFTLIGRQGCYKTSFMQHLLPPELHPYFSNKVDSQTFSKDDVVALSIYLLINLEEVDSLEDSHLNRLKAMTSLQVITERPAYGRYRLYVPRTGSFCATGNNPEFLTDTANRRWLPFMVKDIVNPWEHPLPYEGIYAQAKALLDEGFKFYFSEKEIARLQHHVRAFEAPCPERELIATYYRKPRKNERGMLLTVSQLAARHSAPGVRLNLSRIGRELRTLKFERIHNRNGNFWLMCERTTNERNYDLPTSANDSDDDS